MVRRDCIHEWRLGRKTLLYPAEHAFTRDEGPRFDPEATDLAFAEMVRLFRSVFIEISSSA
jgi:dienelactone hydrolase